jgi:hypothetical protein
MPPWPGGGSGKKACPAFNDRGKVLHFPLSPSNGAGPDSGYFPECSRNLKKSPLVERTSQSLSDKVVLYVSIVFTNR